MPFTALTILFVVLTALVCLALGSLIRGFLQAIRYGGGRLPYEPVVELYPPTPVVRTRWVIVVGLGAVAWSAAHFSLGLVWLATGLWFARSGSAVFTALYFLFGSLLTGVGGAMLVAGVAYGRRMISWGQFLLSVAAFMGLAIALMLPHSPDVPDVWREWAYVAAGAALAYLLVGTAVGAAAQQVGKPPGH